MLSVSNIETNYDATFYGVESIGPRRRIEHGEVILRGSAGDVCEDPGRGRVPHEDVLLRDSERAVHEDPDRGTVVREDEHMRECGSTLHEDARGEWIVDEDPPSGTVVRAEGRSGRVLHEDPFDICPVTLVEGVTIVAEEVSTSIPVIVERACGAGRVVLITVPYGLSASGNVTEEVENAEDRSIPLAYDLLRSVKLFLADEFDRQNLLMVDGEGIQYLTNLGSDENTLYLALCNNTAANIPCRISAHDGRITSITSQFSGENTPVAPGKDVVVSVRGGDIEILELVSEMPVFRSRDRITFSDLSGRLSLGLPYGLDPREAILGLPTFDEMFDSVKLDARYLRQTSREHIERLSSYFSVKGVKVSAVDFRPIQNRYPDLNLFSTMRHEVERGIQEVTETIEKGSILGCPLAIVTTTINAENNQTPEEMDQLVAAAVEAMADICERLDMELLIAPAPAPRWFPSTPEVSTIVERICRKNVALAIDLSHCIIAGENPKELYDRYGDTIKYVALSAPHKDAFGQFCDSHQPVSGSPHEGEIGEFIRHIHARGYEGRLAVDLDMDLASDSDRIYAEYRLARESIALGRGL